ncbi:MAG: glycosyltransferase family 2 protein [Thermoproteota archaeon]
MFVELMFWIFGVSILSNIVLAFFYRRPKLGLRRPVKCVVVTVGDGRVLPALTTTVRGLEKLGLDYVIISSNPLPFRNTFMVPKDRDGNKYRAIRWFVENYVDEKEWYAFFDDDSFPLDDQFTREIDWAEENGYVAANGVLVPRAGRSKLCFSLDWIRYFDDLTRFRAATGVLHKPLFGLHGELLVVKGEVLKRLWASMPESITEDFVFAMELVKKGYKTWQSRTRVSIQSPNSLRDFIRQRGRWARGVFAASYMYRNALVMIRYSAGVFVNILFLPVHILLNHSLVVPAFLASLYYVIVYVYGALKARHMLAPFMIWVEVVGTLYSIKQRGFVVIDKS